jgi:hypothetical protein
MKTAPGYPWGGCLLRRNASGDNRPGAQGKLTLRARLHIPVSFRAVPERHDSMIRGTHKRSNAIFAHLLPGSSLARSTVCTQWRSARTGGSSPPSLGRHGPAMDGKAAGALSLLRLDAPTGGPSRRADRRLPWEGGACRPGRRRDVRLSAYPSVLRVTGDVRGLRPCFCWSWSGPMFAGSDRSSEADAHLGAEFAESKSAGDAPGGPGACPPLRQPAFGDRVGDGR